MQVLNAFAVERWDGTDRTKFAFYLASKAEADAYGKGHPFDSVYPVTLTIFDTVAEAEANDPAAVRERALAKVKAAGLTAAEQAALGL